MAARCGCRRVSGVARRLRETGGPYERSGAVSRTVRESIGREQIDIVVFRHLEPAAMASAGSLPEPVRVVVDSDDIPWRVQQTALTQRGACRQTRRRLLDLLVCSYMRDSLRPVLRRADGLWVAYTGDLDAFPRQKTALVPNIPYADLSIHGPVAFPTGAGVAPLILFVGSLNYAPNSEGLLRFLESSWPQVLAAVPSARFVVVSSAASAEMTARLQRHASVEFRANVADLAAVYAEACFSIAPVHWGGGTNIKVLESLAYGRTCVATSHASRCLHGIPGAEESLLVADSDADFAAACVRLLGDHRLAAALAVAGQAVVSTHFSYPSFREAVWASLRPLLACA